MRNWLLRRLLGSMDGTPFAVQIPFHVSFGNQTHIGKNFFANHGCVIYDHAEVRIGDNVMLGPNVIITAVSHPMLAEDRIFQQDLNSYEPLKRADIEEVATITIGSNVWIAAGAIICPGVSIGDNTVIGAGSYVFAAGVPCKVVKQLLEFKETLLLHI